MTLTEQDLLLMEPAAARQLLHWIDPDRVEMTLKLSRQSFAPGVRGQPQMPVSSQVPLRRDSDRGERNRRIPLPPVIPSSREGDFGTRSGDIVPNQSSARRPL